MHVEQGVFESHIAEAMTKERTTIKVKIMVFMSFENFFPKRKEKGFHWNFVLFDV